MNQLLKKNDTIEENTRLNAFQWRRNDELLCENKIVSSSHQIRLQQRL